MIASQDRSFYFGASDTNTICGKWDTDTFSKWWAVKQGRTANTFKNDAMMAGTYKEHQILEALGIEGLETDKQIIQGRLRVNLDGNTDACIYEVKTHSAEKEFKVSKAYWRQVQVEMYGSGIMSAQIVAYGLVEEDYRNFYKPIDKSRLKFFPIAYDHEFIVKEYLPRLEYLSKCLDEGRFPTWN